MKKFEYKIIVIRSSDEKEVVTQELNKLGEEGWELVTTESFSKPGITQVLLEASTTSGYNLILKREKQS